MKRLTNAGISIDAALELSPEELVELFYPTSKVRLVEPDWDWVHKKLRQKNVTLLLLHRDYKAKNQGFGQVYVYQSFCRRYAQWKKENGISELSGNSDRKPGERMEIDFAGDLMTWVDSFGEIHKAKLFVATLPYSCMVFAEAFENEKQSSWIDGIIDALSYFGGVPEILVMDNAKALVRRTDWREGIPQAAVSSLCVYYDMQPWACKPATPKEKNRVEAAVLDVERHVIAELNINGYVLATDLADLNLLIKEKLDFFNHEPFRAFGNRASRYSRFISDEQSLLKPLPPRPYERSDWKILMVDKAHCIRLNFDGGHRYSVPVAYKHKQVSVRLCRNHLEIYDKDTAQLIATHDRCYDMHGQKTHLLPEHLSEQEKHYRRSKTDWIELFINKGVKKDLVFKFVETLWSRSDFSATRTCGSIFKLVKTYDIDIVNKAIAEALEIGDFRYYVVKSWCERYDFVRRNNEYLQFNEHDESYVTVEHENIRGDYE